MRKNGFTLVEALVVVFLLTIILTALVLTLTTGQSSNSIALAKADLQAKVRRITDWIVRDARQTCLIEINSNTPSQNHIKFKKVTGVNEGTGNYTLAANYIEYDYDAAQDTLTRNEVNDVGVVLNSWEFDHITQSPFYAAQGNPLDAGDILTSKKLVIIIAGQDQITVRGSPLTLSFSLTEEVKIRNE